MWLVVLLTPVAPGAFSSLRRLVNNSRKRSLPEPEAPPFAPFPLTSTILATRSQLVPPEVVSSREARNCSASLRVAAICFSFLLL